MNDVIKAINDRYTCRDYSSTPLTDDQIKALVTAALAAPSAMNRQPWHVIVITNKAMLEEYDAEAISILKTKSPEMYERMMDRGGKILYNAPCLIVLATDNSIDTGPLDSGIAVQNIALAAHSMGLGSVICGVAGYPLSGPRAKEWAERLKMPEGYSFAISIGVGTALSGKEPHELDFGKVTYIK